MHADRSENGLLYKNLGGNRFKDVTEKVGLGPAGWSGDASFADVNGDGFPELYTLNGSDAVIAVPVPVCPVPAVWGLVVLELHLASPCI